MITFFSESLWLLCSKWMGVDLEWKLGGTHGDDQRLPGKKQWWSGLGRWHRRWQMFKRQHQQVSLRIPVSMREKNYP